MLNWIKKIFKRGEGKVVSVVCSADVICLLYVGCLFLGSDGTHSGIEPAFLLCVQPLVQKSPVLGEALGRFCGSTQYCQPGLASVCWAPSHSLREVVLFLVLVAVGL